MADAWWWLSFVDDSRPVGDRFVGACWLQGPSIQTVLTQSHLLGINPGGSVQFVQCPEDFQVPERWSYRLLNRAQIAVMDQELPQ
jgi:hypothetical protein